jgi:hypothetical protein
MTLSKTAIFNEYFHQRHQELAIPLREKKAVFLDTRGWVSLRRAEAGEPSQIGWLPVLHLLRQLTMAGKIFCPISFTTICEVLKQSDDGTRGTTAALMDELSLGIGFCAPDEQLAFEVDREMRSKTESPDRAISIWTKSCMTIMRDSFFKLNFNLPADLTKFEAAFDEVWNAPISKIIQAIGHSIMESHATAVANLNSGSEAHANELKSFDILLEAECKGVVSAAAELLHASARPHLARKLMASGFSEQGARALDVTLEIQAMNVWLLDSLRTDEGRCRLPSLYVHAAIHAHVRWMRKQKLRENDLLDHSQVAQAIAYCDTLLVDRATRNVLIGSKIRLDRLYETMIAVTPKELMISLQSLVPLD